MKTAAPAFGQMSLLELEARCQEVENHSEDDFEKKLKEVKRVTKAIENSAIHADETWLRVADRKIKDLCQMQQFLTVDDLHHAMKLTMLAEPKNPKCYGHVMKKAYREGWMQKTGRVTVCNRPSRNRGDVAVWESRLFDPLS